MPYSLDSRESPYSQKNNKVIMITRFTSIANLSFFKNHEIHKNCQIRMKIHQEAISCILLVPPLVHLYYVPPLLSPQVPPLVHLLIPPLVPLLIQTIDPPLIPPLVPLPVSSLGPPRVPHLVPTLKICGATPASLVPFFHEEKKYFVFHEKRAPEMLA